MTEVEKEIRRRLAESAAKDKAYTDKLIADVRRRDGK